MKLLIQFPTRQRPERFRQYLLRYIDYLEDKDNFHVQVSCDVDDETMEDSFTQRFIQSVSGVSIIFNDNHNKIEAINTGIPSTGWDILLLASDDMWPEERGYDNIIRKEMNRHFPDTDGVLHFNDGIHGNKLNTLAIIGKRYYDRFEYVYNPQYKSLYADNEFDDTSRQLGKHKYIDQVIIRHMRKMVERDRLHKHNHIYGKQDKRTYERRKENNIV